MPDAACVCKRACVRLTLRLHESVLGERVHPAEAHATSLLWLKAYKGTSLPRGTHHFVYVYAMQKPPVHAAPLALEPKRRGARLRRVPARGARGASEGLLRSASLVSLAHDRPSRVAAQPWAAGVHRGCPCVVRVRVRGTLQQCP